ncbi:MAG: zinc ribbon domain-containing protein [Salinirussus sp.]
MGAADRSTTQKRPWLAALLAAIYPGLGHLYLREWLRAAMWFGLIVSSVWLLFPRPAELSVDAYLAAAADVPLEVTLALFLLSILSVYDAYRLAREANRAVAAAAGEAQISCPNCGKEVDADLDFCHWCTERLETADE